MGRKPSGSQLAGQVTDLVKVLKVAQQVFPVYAEQARLELLELTGRLPTSESCDVDDCDGRPHTGWPKPHAAKYEHDPAPYYGDPTGEAVIAFRPPRDGDCDPTEDLERIARWAGDVQRLIGSTRRMLAQAPAVTRAVEDGRRATDGRSEEEHAQRRFVRAIADSRCVIDQDHDDEEDGGVHGQLRKGLCDRHRKAFERWCAEQTVLPLERADRLVRWQHVVFGTVARREERKAGTSGPYRDNLKEVA